MTKAELREKIRSLVLQVRGEQSKADEAAIAYDELTKLHDKLDRKLRQEYGTVQSLEYALDFKCLNDCKIYKTMNECKRICMVPKILIDNSDRGW